MIDLKRNLFKIDVRAQKDEEKVFMRTACKPELMKIYTNLVEQLDNIYRTAPNTTDKAVKLAGIALKVNRDNEFSDEEIDLNLPKSLRKKVAL